MIKRPLSIIDGLMQEKIGPFVTLAFDGFFDETLPSGQDVEIQIFHLNTNAKVRFMQRDAHL